jgi:NAD(P)H-hydrate epimerase
MLTQLRPVSRAEVRQLDALAANELELPTLILMENAGRGAAACFAERVGAIARDAGGRPFTTAHAGGTVRGSGRPTLPRVLVLCGPGNNGGDGGVVARHLDAWGFEVEVIWFARADQLRGDARVQWTILEKSGMRQSPWFDTHPDEPALVGADLAAAIGECDWLIDALLGTGLSRAVEGPLRAIIELMNDSGKPIFALDMPSGLDSDTGAPMGVAVRARATATFVATKIGFSAPGAGDYTGEVAIIDIGLPRRLLEPFCLPDDPDQASRS